MSTTEYKVSCEHCILGKQVTDRLLKTGQQSQVVMQHGACMRDGGNYDYYAYNCFRNDISIHAEMATLMTRLRQSQHRTNVSWLSLMIVKVIQSITSYLSQHDYNRTSSHRKARLFADDATDAEQWQVLNKLLDNVRKNVSVPQGIKKIFEKTDVIVARINNTGEFTDSKPCIHCWLCLNLLGIRNIIYSTNDKTFASIRISRVLPFNMLGTVVKYCLENSYMNKFGFDEFSAGKKSKKIKELMI